MANSEHVEILTKGVTVWNSWREQTPQTIPDLSGIHIPFEVQIHGTLEGVNFRSANLKGMVGLGSDRDWSGSIPSMRGADFSSADLTGAIFWRVDLAGASFCDAILDGAEFEQALMERTRMVGTSVLGPIFRKVSVYGIAAWDIRSDDKTIFEDVKVKGPRSGPIELDHLEIAQFIYMLVHSPTIRRVLDAVTAKAVLILGRFEPRERKPLLDSLRDALRRRGYVPIMFDFDGPANRDLTETISTLAHLSRFVIADITDARSIPQELMAIIPTLPSVPIAPLSLEGQGEYAMFEHFRGFPWVLPLVTYSTGPELMARLDADVIEPLSIARERALKR
jgi:hypothetical protein